MIIVAAEVAIGPRRVTGLSIGSLHRHKTKRNKAWSDGWLAKLHEYTRRLGADVALIVSDALPLLDRPY
jgi:hypothetical protein